MLACASGVAADFAVLLREHTDFKILYTPGETNLLRLAARDEDRGINHASNEVILVVREEARLTLPPGTPFGDAGAPLWILPQSQNVNLLYLGVSAEGLPPGVFSEPLRVELKRFDGPGYFMAWQATGPGQFNLRLNTRDGLSAADAFTPILGSHEHFNWGFSSTGVFSATFQVTGRRAGEATNISSPETTFVFHVLPLPPPTNFVTWQRGHWPPGFHPPTTEPDADPDDDGAVNLLEYASGTSPTNASSAAGALQFAFVETDGGRFGAVTFTRYLPVRDLEFGAEATSALPAGWQPMLQLFHSENVSDVIERVTVRDELPATNHLHRFHRLKAALR
jgi:surface-anchored protein